jgi:hypothetical protein
MHAVRKLWDLADERDSLPAIGSVTALSLRVFVVKRSELIRRFR